MVLLQARACDLVCLCGMVRWMGVGFGKGGALGEEGLWVEGGG